MVLRERTYEKELLDRDDIPFPDIARNMMELELINARLGGHAITCRGMASLALGTGAARRLQVLEVGSGGGDNLRAIARWAARNGMPLTLTGVDINPECVAYAQSRPQNEGIRFVCSDYRNLPQSVQPDIIFSSLFCHHFTDGELSQQLRWMQQRSRLGFFINDLHRHLLAYHSIRLLTKVFSRSYLVKNDAPLSVRRGFRRADWQRLFDDAGISTYDCRWQWAFRWLVCYKHP